MLLPSLRLNVVDMHLIGRALNKILCHTMVGGGMVTIDNNWRLRARLVTWSYRLARVQIWTRALCAMDILHEGMSRTQMWTRALCAMDILHEGMSVCGTNMGTSYFARWSCNGVAMCHQHKQEPFACGQHPALSHCPSDTPDVISSCSPDTSYSNRQLRN